MWRCFNPLVAARAPVWLHRCPVSTKRNCGATSARDGRAGLVYGIGSRFWMDSYSSLARCATHLAVSDQRDRLCSRRTNAYRIPISCGAVLKGSIGENLRGKHAGSRSQRSAYHSALVSSASKTTWRMRLSGNGLYRQQCTARRCASSRAARVG